ncbi:polysaccharide biosynthesis protein [Photobacterium swingsii]|uniref:polysaccharide biosynthesis protein n=1 Tax=Photobacterium swingsii TaxID=680026 RepID=UPI00352F291C
MFIFRSFLSLPRTTKRFISLFYDSIAIIVSLWGAFSTRLGADLVPMSSEYLKLTSFVIIITLLAFIKLGLYRAVMRYLSVHAIITIVIGVATSAVALVIASYYLVLPLPRTIPIIYLCYLFILCGGVRLFFRITESFISSASKKKVIIYGAGSSGRQLAYMLRQGDIYHPICFVDDDLKLLNSVIQGLKVHSPSQLSRMIKKFNIDKILIAMPSASRSQRKLIIESLVDFKVEVLSIPHLDDLVNGAAPIDQLRDVPIEDLLGRDPVEPQQTLLEANIKDKVVMVTGAGGSIGSELCRQILRQEPKALVLFELSEFGLYQIDRELTQLRDEYGIIAPVIPLLGSVQRPHRLLTAMKTYKVDTVYHAAAYKHVPLVEYNVIEGIRNNVYGTYYTAKAAIEAGVESFVLISTDKAVRPTNVMGTTKRMAELGLQALAEKENSKIDGTRFCMVRFGNVLGSSGSVIPLFKKQIVAGGPLTVTHPEITRYFMTIPEAAQLVIQAGAMGKGGDVFVLDMGQSVKITDLAENLIKLSGLEVKSESNPHGDIEIQFSGLRPGEKLYEELLIGDNVGNTEHSRIMTANEVHLPLNEYDELLATLDTACHSMKHEEIRELLLSAPTGFKPSDGISDLVWSACKGQIQQHSDVIEFESRKSNLI